MHDNGSPDLTSRKLALALLTSICLAAPFGSVAYGQDNGYSSLGVSAPNGTRELQQALNRLAANSNDLDALLDAGNAALLLGDPQAALGFFARAEGLDGRNPRVKAGLASALLANANPYEALRLFEQAKALGAPDSLIAADRGLAYDLVGNNVAAQQDYAVALHRGSTDEIVRRYALSLAISGNRKAAEAQLDPLLRQGDSAAWRTRAFVLAIDGDDDGAKAIARSTMQAPVAQAIEPFLEYMDRLTPAQQAAAAHFGHFPKSAQIGQENPRNRQYAGLGRAVGGSGADAGLIPLGEPLGARETQGEKRRAKVDRSERRRPGRNGRTLEDQAAEDARRSRQSSGRTARTLEDQAAADLQRSKRLTGRQSGQAAVAQAATVLEAAPAPAPVAEPIAAPPAQAAPEPAPTPAPASVQMAAAPPPPQAVPQATTQQAEPTTAAAAVAKLDGVRPGFESLPETLQPTTPSASRPFDLASLSSTKQLSTMAQSVQGASSGSAANQVTADEQKAIDLAAMMASLEVPASELAPAQEAVDLSKITPAKPAPPKPVKKADPPPPQHPSRHWVQVAGGANRSTLAREFQRIAATAPDAFKGKQGYWTPLNQTNRILTGPFGSSSEAQSFVNKLAASDISAFTFTSDEGQEIKAF